MPNIKNIKKIIGNVLGRETIQETIISRELNEVLRLANGVAYYFSNPLQNWTSRPAVRQIFMQIIALLNDAKKHDVNVGKLSQRLWGMVQSKGTLSQDDLSVFQSANRFSEEVDHMVRLAGSITIDLNTAVNNLDYLKTLGGGGGNVNLEPYLEELKRFREFSERLERLRFILSRMFAIKREMAEIIK